MAKSLVLVFHKEENGPLLEKIIIALKASYRLVLAAALEDLLLQKKNSKTFAISVLMMVSSLSTWLFLSF